MKEINRIIWPTPNPVFSTWNYYLRSGFSMLGIEVKEDKSFWKNYPNIRGIIPFDIIWNSGERQRIWYDISDFVENYYDKIVKGNDLYFKMQLLKKDMHYSRIYPIAQIACRLNFPELIPQFRFIRKSQIYDYDVIGIFRTSNYKIRTEVVRIIKSQPWNSLVGVSHFRDRQLIPKNLGYGKLSYEKHLDLQCKSKICIDLPGVGGDWTWRSVEILGMGCFCLRLESEQALLGKAENCWGEVNPDLSNLTEKIEYYLANEKEREKIAMNGMRYYEKYFPPAVQAKYILDIAMRER